MGRRVTGNGPVNAASPPVLRARRRLIALGIDPGAEDLSTVGQWYETQRAHYLRLAEHGLHLATGHALYGMTVDALLAAYGWQELPADWSPARIVWPTYAQRRAGTQGH